MISVDWAAKLVLSTSSITDIVAFKDAIRDLEDDDVGMLYDPVITYKRLDLGGGAFMHAVDFVNGYQLKFPNAGNYSIIGNIGATIVPVAGVFVDRTKAAAFATVAGTGGSTGPTAGEIATEVWNHATGATIAIRLAEVWGRLGLDASKPLVNGETSISFGEIVMALSGNETSSTLVRQ